MYGVVYLVYLLHTLQANITQRNLIKVKIINVAKESNHAVYIVFGLLSCLFIVIFIFVFALITVYNMYLNNK
jgi:hypothetical protein